MTAADVKRLQIGETVFLCGIDESGNQREQECTVACRSGHKFLTYRIDGQLKRCEIKDYAGKRYKRQGETA